jgi:aspartate racemase
MSIFKKTSKIIGIIGGMGPSAGLTLHQKIIDNTKATIDQDHLPVLHISISSEISDRTKFIKYGNIINPCYGALNAIKYLKYSADSFNKKLVVGIPCNTFHSKVIYNEFEHLVKKRHDNIELINMIEETTKYIDKNFNNKKIGLLSTLGTIYSNVYYDSLKEKNIKLYTLDILNQKIVNDAIYNEKWGIKSFNNPVSNKTKYIIHHSIELLKDLGVEVIILGCTELPLVFNSNELNNFNINFIDPVDILSLSLIKKLK